MTVSASPRDVGALVARLEALLAAGTCGEHPLLVGVAGAPGVGKSTLVPLLAERLAASGRSVAVVPMDGFHLSRRACAALGRMDRRGAPDTFDADGFVALLRRLTRLGEDGRRVWAPCFEREVHDPVAADIPVDPGTEVVLVEGNYLLLDEAPWDEIPGLLDETWFLRSDDDAARLERLVVRHTTFGRDPQAARAHAEGSDEANARLVARTERRADLVVDWRTA